MPIYWESRMRIFILMGISGVWVYANLLGVKNENLHSVGDIRSLGVCQSYGEIRAAIDIRIKF